MALFDALIAPSLKAATDLIGQFHESPDEKAKALQAIQDAADKIRLATMDTDVQLNKIAGDTIQSEEKSGDKFTERARPMFMYIIEAILGFNYVGVPIAQIFGSHVVPISLPGDLLTLFGVCVTGYVVSRSAEKVAAMPGDSQVSLGGVVKVSNKS